MRTKIEYIRQAKGWNVLEVVYKSGFRRYVYLGDSYYRTTKTQDEFMNNSIVVNLENCTMWLDGDVYKKATI